MFKRIGRQWRVNRALKAKLPYDDLDRAERALYLKAIDLRTAHPHGIAGIQEAELRAGHPVVYQDEKGNVVERSPEGKEHILRHH